MVDTANARQVRDITVGLRPTDMALTEYDAGATPMFNCFAMTAQVVPFTPLPPAWTSWPGTPPNPRSQRVRPHELSRL